MRRTALVLSLLALVSGLHAQEGETVATTAIAFASQRVFRGVEQTGAGAQGTFLLARDAWRLGVAICQPFDRHQTGEEDFEAAYAWKVTGRFKLEGILKPRWFSDVPPGGTRSAFEAGLSAEWTLPDGWAVELAGFHDFRFKADTLQVSVNYSMPLKSLGAYLEWNASIGTSYARNLLPDAPGPAIHDSYRFYGASVRLPYRIGAQTTLAAGWHIAESDGQNRAWSPIAARGGLRTWVDLGLSIDF